MGNEKDKFAKKKKSSSSDKKNFESGVPGSIYPKIPIPTEKWENMLFVLF